MFLRLYFFISIFLLGSAVQAQAPVANFTAIPANGCSLPHTVFFTDQSTTPDTWLWNFGDGGTSTLQNPIHNYTSTGSFTVTLTVVDTVNGLFDSHTFVITVNVPSAEISGSGTNFFPGPPDSFFGCGPLTCQFQDASSNSGPATITAWNWSFGDGNTSTQQNPVHVYQSPGIYTVSLTVTTSSGCTSTQTLNNMVQVIGPDVNFGADDTTICLGSAVNFTDSTLFGAPIIGWAWDFGDGNGSNLQNPSHTYITTGNFDISLTVTDIDGCSRSFTRSNYVAVSDPTADFSANPTSICPNSAVSFTNNSTGGNLNYAWDFGDGNSSTATAPNNTYVNLGLYSVELVVTDSNSCTNSLTLTDLIDVNDAVPPSISCPGNQNVFFNTSCQYTLLDYTGMATASDLCGGPVSVSQSPIVGTVITANQTITLTADDGNGNTSFCTFDVIPSDNIPPTITCPANQSVTFDANCQYTLLDYTAMATTSDNCGTATVSQSPALGTLISTNQTVTLTADDGNGNTSSCTFDVIPSDNTAPTLTCPGNQNVNFDALCQYTILDYTTMAITADNCGTVSVTQSPAIGTVISSTQTITLTADDGNGNINTCTFDVIPSDNTAPNITCPGNQNVNFDANCEYTLLDYTSMGTTSDNCGVVTVTQSPNIGTIITGTQTVTLTADDGNGNTNTCTFDVIPIDIISPVITCPINMTQNNDIGQCGAVINYTTPVGTDNCSGAVTTQTAGLTTGALFPIGTTTNTFVVTDGAGNSSTCSFDVTVNDNEAPTINCPVDHESCDSVITFNHPSISDNCAGTTFTLTSGLSSGSVFPLGTTTNTYTATDASGNTSTCSFDITRFQLPTVDAGNDLSIDAGFSETIDASSFNVQSYDWTPSFNLDNSSIEDPTASPIQTTTYSVTVTSPDGCMANDSVTINVNLQIEINNFMSPNGDGKNDTWEIKGNYLLDDCTVQVFDSWGNLIFERQGYDNMWDGTKSGQVLPQGNYFYHINCGSDEPLTGSITLIR